MNIWQWECFDKLVTSNVFRVTDAGPLISPIRSFSVKRDDKLQLWLETVVVGAALSAAVQHPPGTVRRTTEVVEFASPSSSIAVAHGVLPQGQTGTWNSGGVKETRESATIHSLTAHLRTDVRAAHTIDWLENVDTSGGVWIGTSVEDKREIVETRVIGKGEQRIELSDSRSSESVGKIALELAIGGFSLFLCLADQRVLKRHKKAGYIIYHGEPDESTRKKIRNVLSFCLGRHLIYLGCTTLCAKSEVVSTTGQSAHAFGGRIFELPSTPPAPLGHRYQHEVDQSVLSHMAGAIYAKYDELRFGELSWAYWHAACAPVHMAAAHFGAVIESLQSAYVESQAGRFQTKIVEDARKWSALRSELLKAISETGLDGPAGTKLRNKVSNLNEMPRSATSEALLTDLGVELSPIERAAWKRRHTAAHGGSVEDDATVDIIRETKLLRGILHRMILRITGASEMYHDYYTIGLPTRKLLEPVSSSA